MTLRQRRGTGVNRKAIAATVFAGVLVAGGITGDRFADAGTVAEAADVIVVDGQNFDISPCRKVDINGGEVLRVQTPAGRSFLGSERTTAS
jgi:hypothetical protein